MTASAATVADPVLEAATSTSALSYRLRYTDASAYYRLYLDTERNAMTGFPLAVDPWRFRPGQDVVISQSVTLPAGMASGNYPFAPNLYDPAATLHYRTDDAIRLANADVWKKTRVSADCCTRSRSCPDGTPHSTAVSGQDGRGSVTEWERRGPGRIKPLYSIFE